MMKFLLIDDEEPALRDLESVLKKALPDCDTELFMNPMEALSRAEKCLYDCAFLDIEMGTMNGIELARRLKDLQPQLHVIFVTGYERYALDAFAVHATGYLLKPAALEDVRRELTFLYGELRCSRRIQVRTFGGFDVFVDGKRLSFGRSKSKELLAYLVDRRGSSITLREAANILFEDGQYDVRRRKYMQTIYAELKNTLEQAGAASMLVKQYNSYGVDTGAFDCDSYRFLDGDPIAVNSYRRDYMQPYSWGEFSMGAWED